MFAKSSPLPILARVPGSLPLAVLLAGLPLAGVVYGQDAPPQVSVEAIRPDVRQVTLTLEECLALALENNLELDVERLNPEIAVAGILSEVGTFDPAFEVRAGYDDSIRPRNLDSAREAGGGTSTTTSTSQNYSAGLTGLTPTGLRYDLSAVGERDELSSNDFQPEVDTNVGLTLTQPLLRGAGRDVNLANLRISRRDKLAADADFELQVAQLVTDVYSAYYDLLFRRADLIAQRESLRLAEQLLNENQERLRLGSMNNLDVIQAQSGIASRRADLFAAERALHEAANTLKRLIYRDLENRLRQMPVPADTPPPPTLAEPTLNIYTALELRPDLRREFLRLEQEGIRTKVARNALLPTLDLEGSFRALGQDTSFGRALSNTSEADARELGVGVVFRIPLGARTEKGELAQARLRREQQLLNLKALEQTIIVQVDNAVTSVRTNRLRYQAAQEASRLARETLEAERIRLTAGASTTFVVNQLQRDFTLARTAELSALADWRQSIAELSRVEGTALRANGIIIDEPQALDKRLVEYKPLPAEAAVDDTIAAEAAAIAADAAKREPAAAERRKRSAPRAPIFKR